jgi:predicted metal-dependent enzyme (double-stranded beta helix superfamily)
MALSGRHRRMIAEAASLLVAVADDSGTSLVDVIADLERHVVQETKVGDAEHAPLPPGRRGYTLVAGRLVELARE